MRFFAISVASVCAFADYLSIKYCMHFKWGESLITHEKAWQALYLSPIAINNAISIISVTAQLCVPYGKAAHMGKGF